MSQSDPNDDKDAELSRSRAFRVFGVVGPIPPFIIFAWLGVIAIGLIAIGAAIAYELTASLWAIPVGVVLGVSLAALLGRDFLRWRLSWMTILGVALFAVVFVVAYW